jgi:hypothetical protein
MPITPPVPAIPTVPDIFTGADVYISNNSVIPDVTGGPPNGILVATWTQTADSYNTCVVLQGVAQCHENGLASIWVDFPGTTTPGDRFIAAALPYGPEGVIWPYASTGEWPTLEAIAADTWGEVIRYGSVYIKVDNAGTTYPWGDQEETPPDAALIGWSSDPGTGWQRVGYVGGYDVCSGATVDLPRLSADIQVGVSVKFTTRLEVDGGTP